MRSLSSGLTDDLDRVNRNIGDLETRLKPVTQMNETVGLCKSNITGALDKINTTVEALQQDEEAIKLMRRKDLLKNKPALYAHWMKIAQQILDSKALEGYIHKKKVNKDLQQALIDASDAIIPYIHESLHKLTDGTD